jgi:phage host-nuclease inhibitor protein Gam
VAPVATQQAVTQQVVVLIKDIREDELEAVFKAYSETAKDKADKVDKTKLLELLAGEVIRIGLPTVPTL